MDARDISLAAIFASLYAVINIVQTMLGGPITYGPIQLRLADCLIPLSALFGSPLVLGVSVGCFFGNAYYWLDPADVIIGPIANLIASGIILLLRKRRLLACVTGAVPLGVIIGSYLYFLYIQGNPFVQQLPEFPGLSLPAWAAIILSVTISSIVAITVIGYSLLTLLSRPNIIGPLKSRGLRVMEDE